MAPRRHVATMTIDVVTVVKTVASEDFCDLSPDEQQAEAYRACGFPI